MTGKRKSVVGVAVGVLVALGVTAIPFSAAAASRESRATIPSFRIGVSQGGLQSTLDPAKSQGCGGYLPCSLIYDHLMTVRADGKAVPSLAASVQHPNPTTYVYRLRHGVKFWDGAELTAADVAGSLNYQRYPGASSTFTLSTVKTVVARDRYTVVVTLRHPDPTWPNTAAQYAPIFENKFRLAHASTFGQPGTGVMASGPWMITSYDPTTGVQLSANPHWWGGKVTVQHISVVPFADDTSAALAFRAGQIDEYNPFDGAAFEASSGAKLLVRPTFSNVTNIYINTSLPPWNDVHVRKAFAYVINRSDIIKAAGGFATPETTFIPKIQLQTLAPAGTVAHALQSVPQYSTNLAKAKQEMALSKYPNGFTTTTETVDYANYPVIHEVLAAELAQIGIKLNVSIVTFAKWASDARDPNAHTFVFTSWGETPPDPSILPKDLLGPLQAGSSNFAEYYPAAVPTLVNAAASSTNAAKRLGFYVKLLQQMGKDVPIIPIFRGDATMALSSKFALDFSAMPLFSNSWPLLLHSR